MNINERGIKEYIEKFHETLDNVSSQFFAPDQAKQLLHNSLLPATIRCYVSTQFGVAFEYTRAPTTSIETVLGSSRVEDLVVQAPRRLRKTGPLFGIGGSNISIIGCTLAGAFPFRLTDDHANVTFQDALFSYDALGWVRVIEFAEIYGDRHAERWSLAQAENRAKDEVLAALFVAKQAESKNVSIHKLISELQEKYVLLLGSYDHEGERRLAAIARTLREIGYEPILIKDVPDFEQYDLSQKLIAISALSRFVVIDDSFPSGHLTEAQICRDNRWVTILLRAGGIGASWMTAGWSHSSKVILEKEYNPDNPREAISESVQWAEAKLAEMKDNYKLYPWRNES